MKRAAWLYCAALIVQAIAFHWRVLFDRRYIFPWDFRGVHVPLATFVAESLRRGEAPLWDPYTYSGNPIYANIQTALFYPPAFAASLAGAWLGIDHVPRLLAIAVVLQIALAGIFTFGLLRRLGVDAGAAWVGATVYELGCFFASQAQHAGAVQGAIWLPLIWWGVVELRERLRWFWRYWRDWGRGDFCGRKRCSPVQLLLSNCWRLAQGARSTRRRS